MFTEEQEQLLKKLAKESRELQAEIIRKNGGLIPGAKITDGARTFTVAPMNLRIMLCEPTKSMVDRIGKGPGDAPAEFQEAAIGLLLACVKRNHPEATRDDLLDMVNAGDVGQLLTGIMSASGLRPRPLDAPTKSP